MLDSIDIKQLDEFHASVEKLSIEQPSSFFGRIYRWITHWSLEESNQANAIMMNQVAQEAATILSKIDGENLSLLTPTVQEKLRQFNTDMNILFKEIYPLIEENPFSRDNKLSKSIQEYFSEDIKNLRAEKAQNSDLIYNPEHRIKRKIAKGQQVVDFGRKMENGKGTTGTLTILDVNGKPVGIFKVSDENIPITTRILNIIKSFIGGQLSYLSRKFMAQPKSERAAFMLSQSLQLGLVPASSNEICLQNKAGVFQVFINREKNQSLLADVKSAQVKINEHAGNQTLKNPFGKREDKYFEAIEIIDFINQKKEFTEAEKSKFQKFAIFDYLIGNLDRHEENWFVTMSSAGEITHIKAIDNANAFPKKQPKKNSLASSNQYKWKSLKISEDTFTQQVQEFVKEKLVTEKIDHYLAVLNQDLPEFLDSDMEELIKLRAKVICKLVLEPETTPAFLASYSTKDEMENLF